MAAEMTPVALKIMEKQKYLWKNPDGTTETPDQMFRRVANVVGVGHEEQSQYYEAMSNHEFMPNTPTLTNAGKPDGQLAACFVIPLDDDLGSLYDSLKAQAVIQRSGGGTGFSGARLRSRGSMIKGTGNMSDGSNTFLSLFNYSSFKVLRQGATRKGANMWTLPVNHPDIEEFIDSKLKDGELSEFNISVGITDDFMRAVKNDELWDLVDPHTNEVVRTVMATEIMNKIVENAWRNGEPGVLFIDEANRHNPTPALGKLETTNPCGEQWLLPWEACTLGHVNLAKMLNTQEFIDPSESYSNKIRHIDADKIKRTVRLAVRFLNRVIDINHYPLQQIRDMHHGNRKIGVGVMGFADILARLGVIYGSEESLKIAGHLGYIIRGAAIDESEAMAKADGAFPNFDKSTFHANGLPPRRNACVTTIAPTGSTSIIAGGVAGGCEPIFGLVIVRLQAGMKLYETNPTFSAWLKSKFAPNDVEAIIEYVGGHGTLAGAPHVTQDMVDLWKQANDVTPVQHVMIQSVWQKYVDNSISKTINFPSTATKQDVMKAYMLAWEYRCKGITVYRDKSRAEQVLNQASDMKPAPVKPAPVPEPVKLPVLNTQEPRDPVTYGSMRKIPTGCGNSVIYIGRGKDGKIDDVMGKLGKSGGCAAAWWEALGRIVSIALRHGIDVDEIRKQLMGISCHIPVMYLNSPLRRKDEKPDVITSCADAMAVALAEEQALPREQTLSAPVEPLADKITFKSTNRKHVGACPECGGSQLDHSSGCLVCHACGFSLC